MEIKPDSKSPATNQPPPKPVNTIGLIFKFGLLILVLLALVVLALIALLVILGLFLETGDRDFKYGTDKDDLPLDLNYLEIEEIYDYLKQHYDGDMTESQLMTGIKRGLIKDLGDPYGDYFDQKQAAEFIKSLQGQYSGVGMVIGVNSEKLAYVVEVFPDTPAWNAGIRPDDVILEVDGQAFTNLDRQDLAKITDLIKGDSGTQVSLKLQRFNNDELEVLKVTRKKISVPSVTHKVDQGLGILKIRFFSGDTELIQGTYGLALQSTKALLSQGIKGLILDLRNNPGGDLQETLKFASLWLTTTEPVLKESFKGKVVDQRQPEGEELLLREMPLVILVNGSTASAAEITAIALHEHLGVPIVGQQTFGKGKVQKIITLKNDDIIKFTTSTWLSPKKLIGINEQGITPTHVVEDNKQTSLDEPLDAARRLLLKPE